MTAETELSPGLTVRVMADEITPLTLPGESEGRLLAVQIDVPPLGGPPPLHSHPVDELFHLVAGSLTLFRGEPGAIDSLALLPGASAFVPAGAAHTFRNFGADPARVLCVYTPGEMMARFFATAGRPPTEAIPSLETEVSRVLGAGANLGMVTYDVVPEA